jgi:hypothetical protein
VQATRSPRCKEKTNVEDRPAYCMYRVRFSNGQKTKAFEYTSEGFRNASTTAIVMAQALGSATLIRVRRGTLDEEVIVEMTGKGR